MTAGASPFGPMTLVVNARAGGGRVGKALPELRSHLDARGLEHEVRHTEAPGHATQIARAALDDGCRFLVAVGGDGTVHEVVNGMLEDDGAVAPDAVLGVVAAGTGCDFIRTFGLPASPAHAAVHLDGPESFAIDVGKVTFRRDGATHVRYFPNVAEAGLGAAVVARARRLPRALGPLVYFVSFWLSVARWKAAEVEVDLVDRTYRGPMNNLVVANGQFFGGGMKVAPKAAPTDGLLDVQVQHCDKRESIAIMPRIYKGEHVPHRDILEAKRVRVSIVSERPLPVEADGETLGTTPATFTILRDALRLKV
ncbi:MAG TPA: diacylglycerol kinase family protein [Actinomycetota bacterium]|nr:diacylglycerol kinase family protein [Actinomycetota bacterium]